MVMRLSRSPCKSPTTRASPKGSSLTKRSEIVRFPIFPLSPRSKSRTFSTILTKPSLWTTSDSLMTDERFKGQKTPKLLDLNLFAERAVHVLLGCSFVTTNFVQYLVDCMLFDSLVCFNACFSRFKLLSLFAKYGENAFYFFHFRRS